MEIKRVALVIFDISGYTDFIRQNSETLGHAHEVVSQLLEHVVEGADFPLVLNKFEGDAAFLYADTHGEDARAAGDIARQVFAVFPAFRAKVRELAGAREACPCGACQNSRNLPRRPSIPRRASRQTPTWRRTPRRAPRRKHHGIEQRKPSPALRW